MSNPEALTRLVEEGIIDAVHSRLMSGKEATVYVVERAGELGAAKVYKDRQERTFKHVASYVEGRNQTRNSRDRRAMERKSSYGQKLMEEGWHDMEFRALQAAFDAGVRVPQPFFLYDQVLFMELVVDADGVPASRLADFPFTPEEANALHQEVFMQVKKLLEAGRVHGDLSAYNILMGAKGPTIIDLPQVVDVAGNMNAGAILRRDLRNLTEHLARFDSRLLRFTDCGGMLFQHFLRGTLDMVTGPEVSDFERRGGGGRRGRDAERGRVGREKGPRIETPHGERSMQPPSHAADQRSRQPGAGGNAAGREHPSARSSSAPGPRPYDPQPGAGRSPAPYSSSSRPVHSRSGPGPAQSQQAGERPVGASAPGPRRTEGQAQAARPLTPRPPHLGSSAGTRPLTPRPPHQGSSAGTRPLAPRPHHHDSPGDGRPPLPRPPAPAYRDERGGYPPRPRPPQRQDAPSRDSSGPARSGNPEERNAEERNRRPALGPPHRDDDVPPRSR
jgi:RIO kinase 1